MASNLPEKGGYVTIAAFMPPADADGSDPQLDPNFAGLLKVVEARRRPQSPLRVVLTDEGIRLADRESWMLWLACRAVGSGIGALPVSLVKVVEPDVATVAVAPDLDGSSGDSGRNDSVPAHTLAQGSQPGAGTSNETTSPTSLSMAELRVAATTVGADISDLIGRGRPSAAAKEAMLARIEAARAGAVKAATEGGLEGRMATGEQNNAAPGVIEGPTASLEPAPTTVDAVTVTAAVEAFVEPGAVLPAAVTPILPVGTRRCAISDLVIDEGIQCRVKINEGTINEYAEAMAGGAKFPPVISFYDGNRYWLADGFQRVSGAKKAKQDTIEAEVRYGSRRDAILYAVGANASHGRPRTNADKQRAVGMLLADEEWKQWSDREIARQAAVSPTFVGKCRPSVHSGQMEQRKVRRRGTKYNMKVAASPNSKKSSATEGRDDTAAVEMTGGVGTAPEPVVTDQPAGAAPQVEKTSSEPGRVTVESPGAAHNAVQTKDAAAEPDELGNNRPSPEPAEPDEPAGESVGVQTSAEPAAATENSGKVSEPVMKPSRDEVNAAWAVVVRVVRDADVARRLIRELAKLGELEVWIATGDVQGDLSDLGHMLRDTFGRFAVDDFEAAKEMWSSLYECIGNEIAAHDPVVEDE